MRQKMQLLEIWTLILKGILSLIQTHIKIQNQHIRPHTFSKADSFPVSLSHTHSPSLCQFLIKLESEANADKEATVGATT